MSIVKTVDINKLHPTDQTLNLTHIALQEGCTDRERPEVWCINRGLYIADGHHRIFSEYVKKRNNKIRVNYHQKKYSKMPYLFDEIKKEILEKAKQAEDNGITHITDMHLCNFVC